MTRNEILQSLCYHDPRNPDRDDDEDYLSPGNCYCDHCFHGNTELAEELLRIYDENQKLKETK